MQRLLSLLVQVLVFAPFGGVASTPSPRHDDVHMAIRAMVIRHGVNLTLTVPRQVYPQNALIRVHVRVQNVLHRDLQVEADFRTACAHTARVEVLNAGGATVYPPALVPFPAPPCVAPPMTILHAGETITRSPLVILRGPQIHASIGRLTTVNKGNQVTDQTVPVTTPNITVVLKPQAAPRITLHTRKSKIEALVDRPKAKHGPLLFQAFGDCPGATTLIWTKAVSGRISSGCSAISRWTIVAGWLNQPVATLNYPSP